MLNDWVDAVKEELDIDVDVDVRRVLDVARVAAHNVQRPAAPLTTFLLGVAVGRHGTGEITPDLSEQLTALAERWDAEQA